MLRRRRPRERDRPTTTWAPGWDVPERFNFTRDVIEAYGDSPSNRALSYIDSHGIVDRRTFSEVADDAARWAHALRARIPHPGEPVMVVAGTVPAAYLATLGALKGGLVVVPCPLELRGGELAFRARHSRARLVVADRSAAAEIEVMRDALEEPPDVLYVDEAASELRRYATQAPTEDTRTDERALLLYTAGTGAEPRAVVHTHAALWASRFAAEQWLAAGPDDLVWTTSRAGWPDWIWHGLFGPWSAGAEIVVHDGAFDAEERLNLLQRLAATVVCQSPTEYRALAGVGAAIPGALPRVRQAVSTGARLEADLVELYWEEAELHLRDGLIQAECGLVAATLPDTPVRPGVLGFGAPGLDVEVIDDAGEAAPPGEPGELAVRGRPPSLFAGYLDAPEASAAVGRDGWYRTGDVCVREADGALRYVERADDVIVSAGRRISPAEVEAAVATHPTVAEVAVVASPDPERVSVLKAFVTSRGAADTATLGASIAAHVAAVASPHLVPSRVEVLTELPRTATGKVRRAELRRLEDERHATVVAQLAERAKADADASARRRAEELAAQEERHRAEREAERIRADAEREQNLREAAEVRAREAGEKADRERIARQEAARQEAARREAEERVVQDERLEAERRETERVAAEAARRRETLSENDEHDATARTEREARDAARRADERRKRQEHAEREAAAQGEREARDAARRAEEERKLREREERGAAARAEREARGAAARAEREARDAARLAGEERRRQEKSEREAAALAERDATRSTEEDRKLREREARDAARRAEEERKLQEKAEREEAARAERDARDAARRAEEERKQHQKEEREAAARAERDARDAARRAADERKLQEKAERDAAKRSAARRSADEWDDEPGPDEPIPGLADRIRIYADAQPLPDEAPAEPPSPDAEPAD